MVVSSFLDALYDYPVVASVKDEAGLERALRSQCRVIFLLFGSVVSIPQLVSQVKTAGKHALVHLDLVDGLAPRESAVEFLSHSTETDGVITTKPQLARHAKELGLISLQRFFLLDSLAVESMQRQVEQNCCDLIEVLPGVMPKVIHNLTAQISKPLIAGGLISGKEDVTNALTAGAVAVSATREAVWFL